VPLTVIGGSYNGQVVLAGSGGLAFNAGLGAGSVFAAGGNNLISVYPGAGGQFIESGAGNDTVVTLGADDTVNAGGGSNEILTGAGNDIVNSTGNDLIAAGGIGAATINAGTNSPVAFFGPGTTVFNAGSGNATVVSTTGTSTVNSAGGTQVWLGSVRDLVNSTGADTIIGGSGAATVNAGGGNDFMFAGTGQLDFNNAGGTQTVLGSPGGAMTLHGGSGSIIALTYAGTDFVGGSGSDTVAGFGGAMTVTGGSGSGLFLGGPAGHNSITGGSGQSIILGGGDGDVLHTGTGAGDVLEAAGGAETISAAGSNGAEKLYGGSGADLIQTGGGSANVLLGDGASTIVAGGGIDLYAFSRGDANTVTIEHFSAAVDYLSLPGFPVNEASTALAGATSAGGNETLTLSDGTHIMFQGFTGLTGRPGAGLPGRPPLALDSGQGVLDPGLGPGAPRHGEELEPLLDEEVRVHLGRDEIHPGGDAVLGRRRRDLVERALINVAGVVERHVELDRQVGRADQQDVDARDGGDGIEILQRLLGLDHRRDHQAGVHRVHVLAVALELAPFAARAGIAAVAGGVVAAGAHHRRRLRRRVDHRHDDAARPGVKREADQIGLVGADAHHRRRRLAAHRLDRRPERLDVPGRVLGIEEQEVVSGVGQDRDVDVRRAGRPDDGSSRLDGVLDGVHLASLPPLAAPAPVRPTNGDGRDGTALSHIGAVAQPTGGPAPSGLTSPGEPSASGGRSMEAAR
jgi:Ca2+-binding RTX toxin-like protein